MNIRDIRTILGAKTFIRNYKKHNLYIAMMDLIFKYNHNNNKPNCEIIMKCVKASKIENNLIVPGLTRIM